MKIKTARAIYEDVAARPTPPHKKPLRPNIAFRTLLKVVSDAALLPVKHSFKKIGMENLRRDEPCMYLMNHSAFIDLEIAASMIYPRPFNIVCTSDGFVGKNWLMRQIGCIPTQKFVPDLTLVRDMLYTVKTNRTSILMFPEASYSFDGTATPLPDSLGLCLKKLGIPLVMIRTRGAFSQNPLYNNLQLRRVPVEAEMEYRLSADEIAEMSVDELNALLREEFSFDHFRWQQENGVKIKEPFRADGLNRVLYKCAHCLTEGEMHGAGTAITCRRCGKTYELTEDGYLCATDGETRFDHIPDWYRWERDCVRNEIVRGEYALHTEVEIAMLVDTKRIWFVGEGTLAHTADGFHLVGCGGKLDYKQSPKASYSLYADYYWYEIGDVISIGTPKVLYYCFPKGEKDVVAKTRLATEELYKIEREKQRK